MIVRLVLSAVLAFAPAAQAAVVSGRIAAIPIGGPGLAPVSPAPQITAPGLILLGAPSLASPLAAQAFLAAPALTSVPAPMATPRISVARPAAAASPADLPAHALAPEFPDAAPERERLVSARFDELRAAFDEKQPQDVSAAPDAGPAAKTALSPAAAGEQKTADAPPQPAIKSPAKGLFGFSRPLTFFLLALVLAQVGVEAQTAALPPLITKVFGDVSVAAQMGMVASLTELVGTIAAPVVAKKLGIKKAYLWSAGLRVVTGGLIAGLLAANFLTLPGLVALFAVDSLILGVTYTLEKSIPAIMVDQDQAKLEKFKAARQTAIEVVATVIPIATGALVAACGFIPALLAFPLAVASAMALIYVTLRLPAKIAKLNAVPLPGPEDASVLSHLRRLAHGAGVIVRTPALLFSLLAYAFVYAPTSVVYWLLAPALGILMAGSAAHGAAFAGMITGLYSLGGIIASVFVMREQRKAPDAAAMRKSMLRWTAAFAAASLLLVALSLTGFAWGTLTIPALVMMLFGIPQVAAKLKLESYFQSRAPEDSVSDATAVLEASSSVMIALGLWWFGKMLVGAHVASWLWLAAATAPLTLTLIGLTWALARASKKA